MSKQAPYALKLRVEGPGVQSGTILVPDLLRICQAVQDAVNRQAEAMRGGSSLRPGPKTTQVYDECTLALTGIEKGSTILPFEFAKSQQLLPIPGTEGFGAEVVREVVSVVQRLGSTKDDRPFESGVIQSLKGLGELLDRKRISQIEWIAPSGPGKKPIKAVFDSGVRDRVLREIKQPSERLETAEGFLEMADFKENERKCRIHPSIGSAVPCTFDAVLEDKIYQALRKPVRVTGLAKINAHSGKIEELHIDSIGSAKRLGRGANHFFKNRSIRDLAKLQGVGPLQDPKVLAGGWPADQDVDTFLESIYASR